MTLNKEQKQPLRNCPNTRLSLKLSQPSTGPKSFITINSFNAPTTIPQSKPAATLTLSEGMFIRDVYRVSSITMEISNAGPEEKCLK